MSRPIYDYMVADHRRLQVLLARAIADPESFDHAAFSEFRQGLARHIAIEEKVLLPFAKRQRGGVSLPEAEQMRIDHGAITALLTPTPDRALALEIQSILTTHHHLEEDSGTMYDEVEALAGAEQASLVAKAESYKTIPMKPYYDGPGTHRTPASALEMMRRSRDKASRRR